jgi:TolB-like protein
MTIPELAAELGVDAVVEGSILRIGDRIRIEAQLVDARTDQHLLVMSYDREMRNILALQSEITGDIADQISELLTSEE